MIELKKSGNLLQEETQALVNTVNCVGVMGKGIALQFKLAFPENFNAYKKACDRKEVKIGKMFITEADGLFDKRYIINFPTKVHWREKSKLEYIDKGLDDLVNKIKTFHIKSIAIPPLGCGNGGLNWKEVYPLIEQKLAALQDVEIILFSPSKSPKPGRMKVNTTGLAMTAGRASLIGLLKDYKKIGYNITMLEVQKLMYFLRETGEKLRLNYQKAKYGPYANNLHHVLQLMEKHYISGYGDRTTEAQINILPEGVEHAESFLKNHPKTLERLKKVNELIKGFETPYGLELLSTVHWAIKKENISDLNKITEYVQKWNPRKQKLFDRRHIEIAKKQLEESKFV